MSPAAATAVQAVVTLGLVLVLPLGLRLVGGLDRLARWWPVVGALGAASVWLPRGGVAVGLAAAYGVGTVALALVGLGRARSVLADQLPARTSRAGLELAVEAAVLTALTTPLVGAVALVAERAAHPFLGFDLEILALTVPHMHVAGFAAALVAGLVARRAAALGTDRRRAAAAALTVPAGTLLVLLGYFVGDWAELVGAVVLTAGMWLVAWLTWRHVRPAAGPAARRLLATGAVVLVGTMLLALAWAVGEATGLPHPSLDWMVATHGVVNALGFAVCSVAGWRLVTREAR